MGVVELRTGIKPEYEPSIPAPRPIIAVDNPHGPAQGREGNDNVPLSEEYPSIPLNNPTEEAPDMSRAEGEELAPPPPSHVQTTPTPLPTPVSRTQRVRKPNSLLNPDTWDLSTVKKKKQARNCRRRKGNSHS